MHATKPGDVPPCNLERPLVEKCYIMDCPRGGQGMSIAYYQTTCSCGSQTHQHDASIWWWMLQVLKNCGKQNLAEEAQKRHERLWAVK